jgi:ribonuclease-3
MPKLDPSSRSTKPATANINIESKDGRFLMGVDMQPYQDFCKSVTGKTFKNTGLLLNCFTHRSYVNEHKKGHFKNNERLEYLGDAVLELAVTEFLFKTYPDQPEGILTAWRSALVRTESIGAVAGTLKMDQLLRLSKGEKLNMERSKLQILANTFESFVGSLYLEFGFEVATEFITKYLLVRVDGMIDSESWRDPKSILQEKVQAKFSLPPVYRLIGETGPDHDKVFKLGVYINGQLYGQGSGHSKQVAQQKAAKKALAKLNE